MKKIMKILGIILLVIVLLVVILIGIVIYTAKKSQQGFAEDQLKMPKTEEELIGTHFYVPREGKDSVDVNLYIPGNADSLPIVFNIHGGGFVGGDADTLDTQSDRISKAWNAVVVNINYKLAGEGISIEYGTKEVVDTILYFKEHAADYGADSEKCIVLGYSAGAFHGMAAVLELKGRNVDVAGQILCYPFIGGAVDTYHDLAEEQQKSIAPALFILADKDPISEGSAPYQQALSENGIPVEVRKYEDALHGFIEVNNPEYAQLTSSKDMSPKQEKMTRDAENRMQDWITQVLH